MATTPPVGVLREVRGLSKEEELVLRGGSRTSSRWEGLTLDGGNMP